MIIKPLFSKGPSYFSRLVLFVLITFILLAVGRYTDYLSHARYYLNNIAVPFYWIGNVPNQLGIWFDDTFTSRQTLEEDNARLRRQVLLQEARLQKMAAISNEANRLRGLMGSSQLLDDNVVVAELLGISPDPKVHKVIINKGSQHGAYIGQAVLDAYGLVGQIVAVTLYTSEVLFITDDAHAIPVQLIRNNVRTVIEGIGDLYRLRLRYVPSSMDIEKGDLLVSSGLGGRFPAGYPVATVSEIDRDPGESFVRVIATPTAQLNRSRHVLLVFPADRVQPEEGVVTSSLVESHMTDNSEHSGGEPVITTSAGSE
ncbi:rod shape-determining protein MreC [Eionea flava]